MDNGAAHILVVSPPWLRSDGFVQVDLSVNDVLIPTVVHRSRSVGMTGANGSEVQNAALRCCSEYAQRNTLLLHCLFAAAPVLAQVLGVAPGDGASVVFTLLINEVTCEMDLGPTLHVGLFRSSEGWHEMDEGWEQYGIAYETCLTYLEEHTEELVRLGFDVSELHRQRALLGPPAAER